MLNQLIIKGTKLEIFILDLTENNCLNMKKKYFLRYFDLSNFYNYLNR